MGRGFGHRGAVEMGVGAGEEQRRAEPDLGDSVAVGFGDPFDHAV